MRIHRFYLLVFTLVGAPVAFSAIEIEMAFADYLETGQFQRLSEYFTGREHTGSRILVRSDAGERSGMYFVLRLSQPLGTTGADQVEVEWVSSDRGDMSVHTFDLGDISDRGRWIYCGLTGTDWNAGGRRPVAWSVRLKSGNRILAEHNSFLYGMSR